MPATLKAARTFFGRFKFSCQRLELLLVNDKVLRVGLNTDEFVNINQPTKAINAFKGSDHLTYNDCLMMGNLLFSKNLIPQAEFWYKTALGRSRQSCTTPFPSQNKTYISRCTGIRGFNFQIEKLSPGALTIGISGEF